MNLSEFHSKFPGSIRWRVTPTGIEIENQGLVGVSTPFLLRAKKYVAQYGQAFLGAAAEYGVPVELLIACSLTESLNDNPKTPQHENETCCREEPGFVSDSKTPHRVSAGLCQLLISTARSAMKDENIDRAWLFNPVNSINACAAYMKILADTKGTGFDPIYSACAYNAGGLYEQSGPKNRWKLRQYPIGTGNHANRFAEYFNAAMILTKDLPDYEAVGIRKLIGAAVLQRLLRS
jgi:hypothetical protein